VECPELCAAVSEGDVIEVDLSAGVIHHINATYLFPKFPDSLRKLLEVGGLAEYLKTEFRDGGKTLAH
jgi:3-isopropylmalate/(R)-2-methylmalate dehydratase small subunit